MAVSLARGRRGRKRERLALPISHSCRRRVRSHQQSSGRNGATATDSHREAGNQSKIRKYFLATYTRTDIESSVSVAAAAALDSQADTESADQRQSRREREDAAHHRHSRRRQSHTKSSRAHKRQTIAIMMADATGDHIRTTKGRSRSSGGSSSSRGRAHMYTKAGQETQVL